MTACASPTAGSAAIYRRPVSAVAVVVLLFSLQGPAGAARGRCRPGEFDERGGQDRPPGSSRRPRSARRGAGRQRDRRPRRGAVRGPERAGRRAVVHELRGRGRRASQRDPDPAGRVPSVVVLAARDSREGPGRASSAAATATLLELAESSAAPSTPRRSSSSPPTAAATAPSGARVRRGLPGPRPDRRRDRALAAGLRHRPAPRPPMLHLPEHLDPACASAEVPSPSSRAGPAWRSFRRAHRARVAERLGEQAVLIEDGIDAVGVSAAGERPLASPRTSPTRSRPRRWGLWAGTCSPLDGHLDASARELPAGPAPT